MNLKLSIESLRQLLSKLNFETITDVALFEALLNRISQRGIISIYSMKELEQFEDVIEELFMPNDRANMLRKILFYGGLTEGTSPMCIAEFGFCNTCSGIVTNEPELILVLKEELIKMLTPDDYLNMVKIVYIDILFLDNVKSSLRVFDLHRNSINSEITRHIDGINRYFLDCLREHKSEGNSSVMQYFKSMANIDASAENDRALVRDHRRIKVVNLSDKSEVIELDFELHTKLNISNLNERIYFHCGDKLIQNEKVIIAHVGMHLYDPNSKKKTDYARLPSEEFVEF